MCDVLMTRDDLFIISRPSTSLRSPSVTSTMKPMLKRTRDPALARDTYVKAHTERHN